MMDREQFTSAVLAAEPTLYRVAKPCSAASMTVLTRRSRQSCGRGAAGFAAQHTVFQTWLVRILINECSTILRRQQRLAPYDAAAAEAIPGACG